MTRIMLLATAMVLMPVYAMASANQTGRPQAVPDSTRSGIIPRPILPCTPFNPCAVPPPALSAVPDIPGLQTQARAGAGHQAR
jgi:hypothetical protein